MQSLSAQDVSNITQLPKIDFAVGGQAVIEGVMMRSPNFVTVAVRKPKGNITIEDRSFQSIISKKRWLNVPLVRGMINLVEMMMIGMKMLNFSANAALEEGETPLEDKREKDQGPLMSMVFFAFSVVFALGMSLFFFKFIPLWITDFLSQNFPVLQQHYILFNLVDGVIKTAFFVGYIALLTSMPSFRRIFQYHGAEHKSIYTYEKGLELNVENAQAQTRFHPRCGTSFIVVVFCISILVYTLVPRHEVFWLNFSLRVLFLPLIAGISYELLKWSARKQEYWLVRMMIAPGLWFQRLTTKEPDKEQLEVALTALKQALILEQQHGQDKPQLAVG